VEATPRVLRNYQSDLGVEPFQEWLRDLRDGKGRGIIRTRLNRLLEGNFSNCEPVGEGVHELKIDFGPGYRVYFGVDANLVILLTGGDKDTQPRDIARAKEFWLDYNA
jgi:putative addiction module killer protein